jgi:serine/threonine-protein kinase
MGSVWLADHLALKTRVVVKFMNATLFADPQSRERFSREAVAASQVKSPHVVQTFDHGVTDAGIPFIVMELLEGEDLAQRIRAGPVAIPATASILTQVCRALTRAHAIGIVHRDIKPDNIFLCDVGGDEPFVKLLDFGIAKSVHASPTSHTNTGSMMGTPYYMSPEQFAETKSVDFRSDLWSLGVVVFECLTGVRPFDADTIGGLAIAVHSGPIPAPSRMRHDLSPAIDAWFLRACARDPAARFQNAKALAEAFTQATQARAEGGTPATPRAQEAFAPARPARVPATTTGAAVSVKSGAPHAAMPMASAPRPEVRSAGSRRMVRVLVAMGAVLAVAIGFAIAPRLRAAAGLGATPAPPAMSEGRLSAVLAEPPPVLSAPRESASAALPPPPAELGDAGAASASHSLAAPPRAPAPGPGSPGSLKTTRPAQPAPSKPPPTDPFQPHVF